MGTQPVPGAALVGGSFPRSFLIPGTDTSIRVGGFVDMTALYFLNGASSANPGRPTTNSGQNGNIPAIRCSTARSLSPAFRYSRLHLATFARQRGVLRAALTRSRLNVETRTPTAWGEARTFFEFDWSGCNNFSCQNLAAGWQRQQASAPRDSPTARWAGFWQARRISNFSDADADTESMEFGGATGLDRRLSCPAGAVHDCGSLGQRFLGFG